MIFDLDLIEHINYRDDYIRLPVPRRYIRDADNPFVYYNDNEFIRRYRFYKEFVLNIIMPLVFANDPPNQRGLPVPPIIKITTALRFYATGSFQLVCGDLSKISQSSVCRIINRTSEQLSRHIGQVIKFPRTQAQLDANRQLFYQMAGFPGVTVQYKNDSNFYLRISCHTIVFFLDLYPTLGFIRLGDHIALFTFHNMFIFLYKTQQKLLFFSGKQNFLLFGHNIFFSLLVSEGVIIDSRTDPRSRISLPRLII
jgi:hypothetical protein